MRVYYYTNKRGLDQVMANQRIAMSMDNIMGAGVYFTTLNPRDNAKDKIAWTYFGSSSMVSQGFVDWAIEVVIPSGKLMKHPHRNHIYQYPKELDVLQKTDFKVVKVQEEGHLFESESDSFDADALQSFSLSSNDSESESVNESSNSYSCSLHDRFSTRSSSSSFY